MGKKTNILWLMLGYVTLNTLPVAARNYEKMWKEVATLEQKDLPQSALKSVRTIFNKAMDDNNKGQMLKAYLYMLNLKSTLSVDSIQPDMKRLEAMTSASKDSVEKAVLHSLLGKLYMSQQYNGKNDIATGTTPEDMSEWTGSMYRQKARLHFTASLSNKDLLFHSSMKDYLPVIDRGNTDTRLGNDLLHVIGQTAVMDLNEQEDSAFVRSFYDSLISYYAGEGNRNAVVLTTLRKLDFNYTLNNKNDAYIQAVKQLIADNPQAETCAEAYISLASKNELWKNNRTAQLAFVRQGLAAYPKYNRINALKEIETNILAPYLVITKKDNNSLLPGKEFGLSVVWGNTNWATLEFYRIKNGYTKELQNDFSNFISSLSHPKKKANDFLKRYTDGRPTLTRTYKLNGKPYELNDSILNAPALGAGIYVIRLTTEGSKDYAGNYDLIPVSGIRVIKQDVLEKGNPCKELRIVDAISGKPLTEASVVLYDNNDNETQRIKADDNGLVKIDRKDFFRFRPISPTDNYSFSESEQIPSYRPVKDRIEHETSLYTDRYVYRPGQTVKVAGIAYMRSTDKTEVETNKEITVRMLDANRKQVSEKHLTTNAYGSFSTEFTLPASTLNGTFVISTPDGQTFFKVEEYKRPTFEVTFENPAAGYKAGDSLSVVGMAKTYAGVPLQNTKVHYTISVSQGIWRIPGTSVPEPASGTTTTDEEGRFIVPLRFIDISGKGIGNRWFNYNIKARVLSAAGETQEGTLTLPLSNRSLYITAGGITNHGKVLKQSDREIILQVNNLNHKPVDCKGTYTLIPMKDGTPQGIPTFRPFIANKTSITKDLLKLSSGSYRLIARVMDKKEEVADTTDFILYSNQDVRPPVRTDFWHEVISDEISDKYEAAPTFLRTRTPGKKAQPGWMRKDVSCQKSAVIKVGTSLKDVHLFYRLYNDEACIENHEILLSDSIMTFTYDYKPEYKKGLKAVFTFLKDGKLYRSTDYITFVEPDKKLSLAWETFRDKLVPGQKENWTMWITRNDKQPFDGAEVTVSMYDASLDNIFSRPKWQPLSRGIKTYAYNGGFPSITNQSLWLNLSAKWLPAGVFNYEPLTYSYLTTDFNRNKLTYSGNIVGLSMSPAVFKAGNILQESATTRFASPILAADKAGNVFNSVAQSETRSLFSQLTPRSNFNETAFFYPHLQTDKNGKVTISFTLPDALTKWRFRAIAHTKDMLTGVRDTTITASKDFTIRPNLPRYIYSGDLVSFPANLTNLSRKDLNGIARLELLNPDTQQIIYTESQRFTLQPGKNYALNFKWKADDKYPAVICKIQAVSGNISDGEQNYVAVLNNRELVTESIPLSVNGEKTVTYNLKNLFQKSDADAKDRRLTVEFTSNPVWYAIQALPAMTEGNNEDAISLSSAFYAKSLAQYIATQSPRLKTVFDSWKRKGGNGESLWSNLQKNQELKTILLNETPWVAEAESEAERKQRLSTLFDVNSLTYSIDNTLSRLRSLQNEDGGWSWYKGMQSNEYTTLTIAEQLARLEKLTGKQTTAHSMLEKACKYLMKKTEKLYEQLKNDKNAFDTGSFTLRTYYIQSLSGHLTEDACSGFFFNSWEKHLSHLSNEDKARCAIIMKAAGRTSSAKDLINSLLEHTVQTEEQGRYFDVTSHSSRFYREDNRIPTQTLVIEALKEDGTHQQDIDDMNCWLLKQKQTQAWSNAVQSANCVYALLIGNTSLTLDYRTPATLSINGKNVITDKDMAGLGYIHYTCNTGDIINHPSTLTITKATSGVAWGGVYAQYTLPQEKIVSSVTANDSIRQALSIRREFYIERTENGKNVRIPLNNIVAKVGDKLISRLIIKTDRDLEFVQIKDGRTSCAEPSEATSGYCTGDGIGYYESPKDASTNYYCDRMSKGTYIFENTSYIDRSGSYMSGIATVQCAYAPEFTARTESVRIEVK